MAKSLKPGDAVEWNTGQGKTRRTMVRKQTSETSETSIKGHAVKARKGNREFIVQSVKSGVRAAHRPDALKKI